MLRYTILDIIINDNDNISQETFECFTEAIEENPKIDLIKYINQEIADYVVKWIKRRIDSKSSPHFTIEVKSDTEVIFKVHKKVQFNQ